MIFEFPNARFVAGLLTLLFWLSAGTVAQGQGSEEVVTVLDTIPGEALISEARPVSLAPVGNQMLLQFKVGFGTDEVFGPGTIFDAFSLTLQAADFSRTWVLATFDASGVVWAPATPGTEMLEASSIGRASITTPSFLPDFGFRQAYALEMALPEGAEGQPLQLYFDLFNNQNQIASQGWFTDIVIVPEPGVMALVAVGLAMLWWLRQRRVGRHRTGSWLVLLGVSIFPADANAQAEQVFVLNEVSVTLVDVTPDAAVYYSSMRLNRALNVWNVEMTVSNRSAATLSGPVVVLVEGFTGTSGLQGFDGTIEGGKRFLDLGAQMTTRGLAPGQKTSPRTLTLGRTGTGSPVLTTRVFAARPPASVPLGLTRTLNEVGQPLPSVTLQIAGPTGAAHQVSDRDSGVSSFGQTPGAHTVMFSREGYLPVWRRQALATNEPVIFPNPRLSLRSAEAVSATPLGGVILSNSTAGIRIEIPAGALSQAGAVTLTPLSGQTLPAFLPLGWSPLSAFWVESSSPIQAPLNAMLRPLGAIAGTESAVLARWDETTLQWIVMQSVPGNGTNAVTTRLPAVGAYALIVADTGEWAPPAVPVGQPLAGASAPSIDSGELTASGNVTPSASPASVVPALVTGTARLEVRHSTRRLPSGYVLRGEVTETYLLSDGSLRLIPQYEHFIVAYQRPGDQDAFTLHASFPMRPVLVFGPEQLDSATVKVDVLPESAFDGEVLDQSGGQIGDNGVRVLAGTGRLVGPSAVQLRRLDAAVFTNLVGSGHTVIAAFDLTVDRSTLAGSLSAQLGGAPANAQLVMARVLSATGFHGLQPIERLRSDSLGNITSLEPATGTRLPGLAGSGQFVLVQVNEAQTLVEGVARNGAGNVQSNMPVSLVGLPWLTLSGVDGTFQLVGPAGERQLSIRDPLTGDAGFVGVTVGSPTTPVTQDLSTAARGPRVAKISPADNATRVPRVGSVVIEFNEAVNPASIVNAIQLLRPDDSAVPASVTLNLANRVVTLTAANELAANTTYRVQLAETIRDPSGLAMEGDREFSFTTVPAATRVSTAQLVIYEPGATNVPGEILNGIPAYEPGNDPLAIVVHGQPGVADPEVAVILANESTGETTTVLSRVDGGFSSVISGTEEDFISATFVNLNGTRVYVPVSRQEFDNGFVGLYPQGGILEAQSDGGPVKVIIAPNSIPIRTKFKMETLGLAKLLAQLGGVTPADATIAGGGLNLRVEGTLPTEPMQVRFPVNLRTLGYPTNEAPTNAAAVLAVVRNDQDVTSYEVMDQMLFTPQIEGEPLLRAASGDNQQIAAGFLDTSIGLVLPALGRSALPIQIGFNQVLVPLLFGPRPVVIKGKTASLPFDLAVQLDQAGVFSQVANLQTGIGSVDVPFQLAQTMGFFDFGFVVGQVQSVVNVAVTSFQQRALAVSKPLSGAFVSVTLSGGVLAAQRGRLFPGMVYSTSGADGHFLAVAPAAGANYLVTATHPRFRNSQTQEANPISKIPGQQGDLSLAGAVFKNFFFQVPTQTETPPTVSFSTEPTQPAAGQPARLVVNASQPAVAPKIQVKVLSVGAVNLLTGLAETNVDFSLGNEVLTTVGTSARWTGTLNADKPVAVRLLVKIIGDHFAQDAFIPYVVAFTGPQPPVSVPNLPKPDTNDVHGPLVVEVQPPDNGFVGEDAQVVLFFNKPVDSYVTNHLSGITLAGADAGVTPILRLSPNQRSLTIQYPGLKPGGTYQLTVSGQSVRDLAGQPLDQLPSTDAAESFATSFRTPPAAAAAIPGLAGGRGVTISGDRLYVIEQAPPANQLAIYDISIPLRPRLLSRVPLVGQPRDLTVVPQFSYKRSLQGPVVVNDMVVVVGGDLDAVINQVQGTTVSVKGQFLWAIAMEDDGRSPQVIASPVVSFRVSSVVPKVRWEPPFLVYQEYGQDVQLLGFVNLQEMLIGFGSDATERASFPTPGRRNEVNIGKDLNGDGDYVDEGETVPVPDLAPSEFYGKHHNIVLQNTTQKILDFSVTRSGAHVGVTLRNGRVLDEEGRPIGPPLPPMYRTLVSGGLPLDIANPVDSSYQFDVTEYPRWVTLINNLPIEFEGARTTINAALVSLQPDSNGVQTLAVLNISVPLTPRLVGRISIPDSLLGGAMQSAALNAQGVLELAGSQNVLLLDPARLGVAVVPPGQLHPSILSVIPNAGAGSRSIGASEFGVRAVAEGTRGLVVQSPPPLVFVSFPTLPGLVEPRRISAGGDLAVSNVFHGMRPAFSLAPVRVRDEPTAFITSDLEPQPNLALHYHVLVTAPGAAGRTIELGLESLNPAGRPLSNPGFGFAPVRAVSESTQDAIGQRPREFCGAAIRSLTAWRLSDDPNSPHYNRYLSRPFALVTEAVTSEELFRFTSQFDREIIFSGAGLRAFIDPGQATHPDASPVIGPFAAQIDGRKKMIFPISEASAFTVNRDYIVGDNPPPSGGASPLEDTYGAILAHSGELRTTDVDMSIPSPRMPIGIFRTTGNQDTYEGPFGVGWDFNYNQRLTILDPLTFPAGLQMPLVVRETREDSDIAGSQDVMFNDGEGRVIHFRWMGTNMPPVYAPDPLVQEFKYAEVVSDYYLPQRGVFNLLVKFKDGRFERLTPDGKRYRYAASGRLEMIIDSYPQNRHELQYDRNGWLVRIDDRSVSAPRYVEVGHYRRRDSDPDFIGGLDENTANSYLEGLICRLRDYTGRDVLFEYDAQGFLIKRRDVEVGGDNGGFAGRAETFYAYANCRLVSITASASGAPLISATTTSSASGEPVAQSSTGSYGNAEISVDANNSAKTVGNQTSGVKVGDGTTVQRTFDKRGNVTSTTVSGPGTTPVTQTRASTEDGRLAVVRNPEGNVETMTYDSDNPVFRSRGNLISVTIDPGPRGGQGHTMRFNFDPRYNLPSGEQIDANGFKSIHTLTSDGRAMETVTFEDAGTRTATYNSKGQITRTVDENGVEQSFNYSGATGFLQSQAQGATTYTYGYDGSVASRLGRPASIAPPLGAPTLYRYDNRMQPVEIARGARVKRTGYDENGRAVRHVDELGEGRQLTTVRIYNENGFLLSQTLSGVDVNGSPGSITTTFVPDSRSRVEKIIHANGTEQKFTFDSRGNATKVVFGDYTEEFDYDLNNNVTSVKQGGEIVRTLVYDGLDRATQVIRRTGTQDYVQTREFRPGGELRSEMLTDPVFGVVNHSTYDSIDALGRHLSVTRHGNVISPQYTYAYRVRANEVAGPRVTSTTTWDKAGNTETYTDPILQTVIHRDENGRAAQLESREQGATYSQTFTFNDLDQRTSLSDALGIRFTYEPRADGNDTRITNPRNNSATMEHTALGELQKKRRADGMEVRYRRDVQRQTVYEGDPDAGFNFGYDSSSRLTSSTLRGGAAMTYRNFDPRSMPTAITIPGGTETRQHDWQRRLTERRVTYQSTTLEEAYTYDAMDRIRSVTYLQNGGAQNSARFDYDPAGPLVAAHFHEENQDFTVGYGYYADGGRRTITYPSGAVVTEVRDPTGRLTGLSDANGNIVQALSWQGNSEPKVLQLGANIQIVHQYDARGRTTGSRVTRLSDGAVLVHMRYQYDPANNIQIRQFVHRGGKADVFGFDSAERVTQAQVGVLVTNMAGNGPALYGRHYGYQSAGLDYLTTVQPSGIASRAPPFATNWTSHDAFLLPRIVDGFSRGAADPKGNVASAQLWVRPPGANAARPVSASIEHDGLGRLTRISRADGVTIENLFQPGGLRIATKVSQGGSVLRHRSFVYDSDRRLIEEYDRGTTPVRLVARYYYGSGDAPLAADLTDPGSGELRRYFYLTDVSLSVVAVADAAGDVVERVWYDTFGQPHMERRDAAAPVVSRIQAEAGGSLLIGFSEPIQPRTSDPGPGGSIVTVNGLFDGVIRLSSNPSNAPVAGVITWEAERAGFAPFSVLRFTPTQTATGSLTMTLSGGAVADEWGNTNLARTFTFTNSQVAGATYFQAAPPVDTAPVALARSDLDSPFLFHGQYAEYESGLLYLRARFYDPFSGMFLEPDPLGYEDSVNHYAGLGNNPVSFRDPSGLRIKGVTDASYHQFLSSHGYEAPEMRLLSSVHSQLTRLGMGDLEIAAHVRVMYQEHLQNRNWEIGIRSFGDKADTRIARVDEFHQTKEEKVYAKTLEDGLARHEENGVETGEVFAGDLDGLYAKLNGDIAHIDQLAAFQNAVNAEVARLSGGWRNLAAEGGQTIHGTDVQKAYQHGFSLNIPQEFGSQHALSDGGRFGFQAVENINKKMKKGIGEAFSFTFKDGGIKVNEHVDVDAAVREHEAHYQNVLFNPAAEGRGFNRALFQQRIDQFRRDRRVHEAWFPLPFYIQNN